MGVCNCSMFCCTLLYVRSSVAIILMGKRGLVALLGFCFASFVFLVSRGGWGLFLAVPRGCLRFVIVVYPDHTHLLFFKLYTSLAKIFIFWFFEIGFLSSFNYKVSVILFCVLFS